MKSKLSHLFFNPFVYVAGYTSLGVGLFVMLLTAILGYFSNAHLEGVIGVGIGYAAPFHLHVLEALVAWISLSIMLIIAGRITSKTSFRLIDLVGTQALARTPMFLAVLIYFPESIHKVTKYLVGKIIGHSQEVSISQIDLIIYVLAIIMTVLVVIWTVVLMYNAYRVSCNLRGTKAGISFTIALIVAHIISIAICTALFGNGQLTLQEYFDI